MLRNALQHETADHVPVLAEEVRELLAVQPGETVDRRHVRRRRPRSAPRRRPGRQGTLHRDRPRRERAPVLRALPAPARACRRASCAATSRSSSASWPTTTSRPTRSCSTSASRACRSTVPSAASPTRPMRRSTCAWTRRRARSARDIVNESSERELADIFRRYGEERFSRQIARAIVRRRAEQPFERTTDLVEVVRAAIPAPRRFGDGHPAKRVFQALRIVVNEELESLERGSARRAPAAAPGRAPGRDQLPLARGPHRQALLRRPGARLHVPARPADLRLRQGADAPPRHAQGRAARRRPRRRTTRAPPRRASAWR